MWCNLLVGQSINQLLPLTFHLSTLKYDKLNIINSHQQRFDYNSLLGHLIKLLYADIKKQASLPLFVLATLKITNIKCSESQSDYAHCYYIINLSIKSTQTRFYMK